MSRRGNSSGNCPTPTDNLRQTSIKFAISNMSVRKRPFKFKKPVISATVIEIDSSDDEFDNVKKAVKLKKRRLPFAFSSDEESDEEPSNTSLNISTDTTIHLSDGSRETLLKPFINSSNFGGIKEISSKQLNNNNCTDGPTATSTPIRCKPMASLIYQNKLFDFTKCQSAGPSTLSLSLNRSIQDESDTTLVYNPSPVKEVPVCDKRAKETVITKKRLKTSTYQSKKVNPPSSSPVSHNRTSSDELLTAIDSDTTLVYNPSPGKRIPTSNKEAEETVNTHKKVLTEKNFAPNRLKTSTSQSEKENPPSSSLTYNGTSNDQLVTLDSDTTLVYNPAPVKEVPVCDKWAKETVNKKKVITKKNVPLQISTSQNEKENPPPKTQKEINYMPMDLFIDLLNKIRQSEHFEHLVSEDYKIVDDFLSLRKEYQYLCFKLYTRKDKWKNIFELSADINLNMSSGDVRQMYEILVHKEFLDTDCCKDDIFSLLNNLTLEQVKELYSRFRLGTGTNKKKMIDRLILYCKKQNTLCAAKSEEILKKKIKEKMLYYVKLKSHVYEAFNNFYLLATFVNMDFEKISDFFNSILYLKYIFPEFDVEKYSVFATRKEFLRYCEARKCKLDIINADEAKDFRLISELAESAFTELRNIRETKKFKITTSQEDLHTLRFCAETVYIGILTFSSKRLTTKYPEEVKTWLEYLISNEEDKGKIGTWYMQLSWIYSQYLNPTNTQKAAELLMIALQDKRDNLSEIQLHDIGQKAKKLLNNKKERLEGYLPQFLEASLPEEFENFPNITIKAQSKQSHEPGKKRDYYITELDGSTKYMSVEEIARYHYIKKCNYNNGIHCEGNVIHATFLFFFWDLIYDYYVPGMFISRFQCVPIDFFSEHFYLNRKNAIDDRLSDIESGWTDEYVVAFLQRSFYTNSDKYSFCNANEFKTEPELLETLLICIGRKLISDIYRKLVSNIKIYRSGLPDLLLWNEQQKKCKFVEVKGEGDVLQTNQKLWLKYLRSIGADVEVCHVNSTGTKKKQKKGKN